MIYMLILKVVIAIALLVLARYGVKHLPRYLQPLVAKGHIDQGMVQLLSRLMTVAIFVLAALVILQILGLNIVPLVAFGGIGAAALGFAAKDVIANFCGGLMLSITRPFTVGDLILVPNLNLEGYVEDIGWYLTSLRDKEKRPVYLPNAIFSNHLMINSSRMSHRRILETINLRYEDVSKVVPIVDEIRKMITTHPLIDTHVPILVNFDSFHKHSLGIYIDVYTRVTRHDEYLAVKQDVLLKIEQIVNSHGAQMPLKKILEVQQVDRP
jgi:MscS family membrane protein